MSSPFDGPAVPFEPDEIPDSMPEFLSGGGMMAAVTFVRVDPETGAGRVRTMRVPLPAGGGPELERLRLVEAAVQAAAVLAQRIARDGWRSADSPRRGPPIGPERQRGEGDSGEGSPL